MHEGNNKMRSENVKIYDYGKEILQIESYQKCIHSFQVAKLSEYHILAPKPTKRRCKNLAIYAVQYLLLSECFKYHRLQIIQTLNALHVGKLVVYTRKFETVCKARTLLILLLVRPYSYLRHIFFLVLIPLIAANVVVQKFCGIGFLETDIY